MSTTQYTSTKRPLVLTEEQKMIKESARDFLKNRAPVAALRKLRDEQDAKGYDPQVWSEMAELGWPALVIPESFGGLGYGYTELGQVLEECGRTLTASPLVSSLLLAGSVLQIGGSQDQKSELLPAIASGETLLTMAIDEGKHHSPNQTILSAQADGDSFVLNGNKSFVIDGHVANQIIVVARTSGNAGDRQGISLFLLDSNTEGLSIQRKNMADSRNYANMSFDQVRVSSSQMIGAQDQGGKILEKALDIARIGLSAELLGTVREAFDRTVNYLKERQQFGVPIGSFQGLQHRAAMMYCEIELCKSAVLKGLHAIDADDPTLPALASLCKAKVGQTAQLVSNEAVQMYGGIGMTDDEEIGFFLKRARVVQHMLGTANFHLDRLASMSGY